MDMNGGASYRSSCSRYREISRKENFISKQSSTGMSVVLM